MPDYGRRMTESRPVDEPADPPQTLIVQITGEDRPGISAGLLGVLDHVGATMEDIREALMHVAIYAGVPAANHAIKIAKKTYAEMDQETSS